MTIKRKTEITIETHNLMIIRTRGGSTANFVYCQNCQIKTAILTPMHAALIFRVGDAEIEHLFQTNQIHFADDSALCGNSLAEYFKQEIRCIQD